MKYLKARLIPGISLLVLAAAFLVPTVVKAQCPLWPINCGYYACSCAGTPQGTNCSYDMGCINGGCCKSDLEFD